MSATSDAHAKHSSRRLLAGLAASLLLLATVPLDAQAATRVFSEGFEGGLGAWTVTGSTAGWYCGIAQAGSCSLRLDAACCGSYVTVAKATSLAMTDVTTLTFYFRAGSTTGDSDAAFSLKLDQGRVWGWLTEGVGENNGLTLHSDGFQGHVGFATWPSANTWYGLRVTLDPAADTATAQLLGGASSTAVPIPAGASSITEIAFSSVFWGGGKVQFHVDSVSVDVGSLSPPAAPRFPYAFPGPGAGEITVRWWAPLDTGGSPVTEYRIYRSASSAGPFVLHATVPATAVSFRDAGLGDAATWHYRVSAVNEAGEGPLTPTVSATTYWTPGAVTALDATAGPGVGEVTLRWDAPADTGGGVTGHRIYRGTASGAEVLVATVGAARTWKDQGRGNGNTYYYKVRAFNPAGEGPLSNEDSATTFAPPGEPRDFTATGGLTGTTLRWEEPATDGGIAVAKYRLYRGPIGGSPALLAEVPASNRTFVDRATDGLSGYDYWLSAVNGAPLEGLKAGPRCVQGLLEPCSSGAQAPAAEEDALEES